MMVSLGRYRSSMQPAPLKDASEYGVRVTGAK